MTRRRELVNIPPKVHVLHVGDLRTPIGAQLFQGGSAIDLTGLAVEFKMIDEDGATKVAQSGTGVTLDDAANGKVSKTFVADDVDTAGNFFGYFVVLNGSDGDHFPVDQQGLLIQIQDD